MNLVKYKDNFIDNGVEDLETILELSDNHLESMNIPLGHRLKMMKKIKEIRKDKGMDEVVHTARNNLHKESILSHGTKDADSNT